MVSVATTMERELERASLSVLDDGVPIGVERDLGNRPVCLSDHVLAGHLLALGMTGTGKSTLLRRLAQERAAAGDRVVVVDGHGDLARQMAEAGWGRLVDFGSPDDGLALGLLDPAVFPDREQAVSAVLGVWRYSWQFWGQALELGLRRGLESLYEWNRHPLTTADDAASPLHLPDLLSPGEVGGIRRRQVAERVGDDELRTWLERSGGLSPANSDVVQARVGAYQMSRPARRALDVGHSSSVWMGELRHERMLLIAGSPGHIGMQAAGLLVSAATNWAFGRLREQGDGTRSLLVADEFIRVFGVDWQSLLTAAGRCGCAVALSAQWLWGRGEGPFEELEGYRTLAAFRMSRLAAGLVADRLGWTAEQAAERLSGLEPWRCYVRTGVGEPDGMAPVGVRLTLPD